MKTPRDLSTACVRSGELDDAHGSPHTPLYNTSTFAFKTTADILDAVEGKKAASLYTRYGLNPTVLALEGKLKDLEGAQAALAFCSGMAAESALFLAHGLKGVVCLGDAYGGTLELLSKQLPQLGVPTKLVLRGETEKLARAMAERPGLLFFETPTNPALELFDIAAMAELAHAHGALLAVDSTFASPVNQQPLALGADLVVHSATKYLGGHSDITAGCLMGPKDLIAPVWEWRKNLGQSISPETAALLSRSLRTLPLRVARQNETALAVARAMAGNARVERVYYPGLPDFPGHELAQAQMSGFGGMVTLDLKGGFGRAAAVVDALELFRIAPSLGGSESLATMPVTTTHFGLGREEQARRGIGEAMVRLSLGLEAAADLIADLERALASPGPDYARRPEKA